MSRGHSLVVAFWVWDCGRDSCQDCERIVQACKSGSFLILGIEAFRLAEGNIVPKIDLIADFSELISKQWDEACLEAARSAESYFGEAKGRTDLWFDFSLKGRE